MNIDMEIKKITSQIINIYNPQKLIMFGSQAKNTANNESDIDLCLVIKTSDKRNLLTDMYLNIDCDKPFDLLLYTPDEWKECVLDHMSFAYVINKEGIVLYG